MKRHVVIIISPYFLQKKIYLLSIVIAALFFSQYAMAEDRTSAPPYMAWKMIEQRKTSDEAMLSRFFLSIPEGVIENQAVEVWYQVTPWQRKVSTFKEGAPVFYTKKPTPERNGFSLTIESGGMEKIMLWAKTKINGRPAFAQTLFYSFGNSGHPHPDSQATRIDPVADGHEFDIGFDKSFYRAQTGEPIFLRLNDGHTDGHAILSLFENGRALDVALSARPDGIYEYTPPHRTSLSQSGFTAKEDLVFVADLKEEGVISFYLPLYRSLHGNSSLPWGVFIAFCSAVLCLWLVKRSDKRFKRLKWQ